MAIGDIGHWRDSAGSQIPGTTYAGFNFASQQRNDNATYTKPDSSTIELEEAGDYLFWWHTKHDDSSNGRVNYQSRAAVSVGSGSLFTTNNTTFSRNSNNRTSWTSGIAYYRNAAINDRVQIQARRDTDTPTGGSVINASDVQVVKLSDANGLACGLYTAATVAQTYGGTTPVDVAFDAVPTVESDTATIELQVNNTDIRLKGDNKRYFIAYGTGGTDGGSRTQRVSRAVTGTTLIPGTQSYFYQRNSSNELGGLGTAFLYETGTADEDISIQVWTGDGVLANQGGANSNGNWDSVDASAVVIELPDSVEVFAGHDGTGVQTIAGGVTTTINGVNTMDFNDSASFTRTDATQVNCEVAMDVLAWGNIWTARNEVGSGTRGTFGARIEIAGVDQTTGEHGNYSRGNQGTQDTFGWAAHPGGIYATTLGQDLELETFDSGDNGSQDRTQPNTVGFFGINLDTLEAVAGTDPILGTTDITFTPTGAIRGVGQLAGSSDLTFTNSGALSGVGLLAGSTALDFTTSGDLSGVGSVVGSTDLSFSLVGDMSGAGLLSGVTNLTFTENAVIGGLGELSGLSSLTFTASGDLQNSVNALISGSTGLTFTSTGDLAGIGGVSGSTSLTFTESASLSALGALSGSSGIDFTPTGDLLGFGDLSGATTLTFTVDGDLQDAAGGFISGSSDITFTTSGVLAGSGALSGSTNLDFAVSGSLQGKLFAVGATDLTFTTSGDLQAIGRLSGASGITFSEIGAISARGALSGSSGLTFTATGAAQDANSDSIAGSTGISFVATGNLVGYGLIKGSTTLTFTASARHEEEITDLGGAFDSGSTDDEDLLLIIREFLRVAA
jgi:hypothetical protein